MPMPLALIRELQEAPAANAWTRVFQHAWSVCSPPLNSDKVAAEVARRDADLAPIDLFLATAGWDLWRKYESDVPRTASRLKAWWSALPPGRAVLILDALSLREAPWLLEGARAHGYTIHSAGATGAELPADTDPFARALGFTGRASLKGDTTTVAPFSGAAVLATEIPWEDCADHVNASPDWVLWHYWQDELLHQLSAPGHGLTAFTLETSNRLRSEGFWKLVHCLTQGRRLLMTGDHGYAASGQFHDTPDAGQAQYLKEHFKGKRWAKSNSPYPGVWIPPLDLSLQTAHTDATFVLGRRKWKSQSGYPTLVHGGLTVLEVAVPFIELSRPGGA